MSHSTNGSREVPLRPGSSPVNPFRHRSYTIPWMGSRLLTVLVLAACATGTPRAQAPAATITIDLSAADLGGAPLTTLRAEDLALRIDNRPHPIDTLRFVPFERVEALLKAPYGTNQIAHGRTIVLAVDATRLQTSQMTSVKEGIHALLPALGARDRLGLLALASDGSAVDFTTRHDLVVAASAALKSGAPAISAGAEAEEAAALAAIVLLDRLCASIGTEPGPKTVVFMAPPFATSTDVRRALLALAETTGRHRVQLFIIDPVGTAANLGATAAGPAGGLAAMAALTGGLVVPSAIAALATTRYELQFTPTTDQRNNKPHRVMVVSQRQDARIAAPSSVFIGDDLASSEPMPSLTHMLRESRGYRDLPLRLVAYPVLDDDRTRPQLLILAESENPSRSLAWAEFALISPSGTIVAQWKAEGADAATRPMRTRALAPAGPYRLRMAASELSGRRGAVDYEFDAGFTPAGTFELGPLMFGGMNAADSAQFVPVLQPAANATAIMAYTEIYGALASADTLGVRFEMAHSLEGEPIASVAGSVRTSGDPTRRAALGTLDLSALPVGDHLVRAIITLNGAEVGRVTRTLRKVGG